MEEETLIQLGDGIHRVFKPSSQMTCGHGQCPGVATLEPGENRNMGDCAAFQRLILHTMLKVDGNVTTNRKLDVLKLIRYFKFKYFINSQTRI